MDALTKNWIIILVALDAFGIGVVVGLLISK
jgi:hypothetical protein